MKPYLLSLALLALTAGGAWADLKITGPTSVPANKLVRLEAVSDSKDAQFLWDVGPGADVAETANKLWFTGPAGTYAVSVIAIDFTSKKVERARTSVVIGEPVPPVPPGPGPTPVPPVPPPSPAPIDAPGLRVLIVYESDDIAKMPAPQQAVLFDKGLRDYLRSKCLSDKDNPNGAWNIFDKDVDTSALPKDWQDAMKRPRTSLPWVIISNKDKGTGFEGPLPGSVADTMALLKKYAEGK